ncbi:MAG: hypothetical protein PHY56_00525 [Candidatus Omnitrophica bacterium]|nr:hypothetical protein [Candidatus Omnitrophota bacterium]
MKRILIILLSILFITSISYAGVVSNIVGGGGGGTGASVTLDTSSFGTNLSAADTTVQKALDTLDEAAGSGAPTTAHYLTDQAEDGLSAEVIVSANGKSLVTAADYAAMKGLLDIDDVITLSGLAAGSVNLGEFTGSTITDNQTVKAALQLLESAVEGKQAADADLTDLADGSLTASKVAGVVDADYGDVIVSSGAWAVEDDSHAHTSSSISGLDISADTNLTAGDHITLTDDDLDIDDDFLLNNGDVGTGVYDFGGATRFEIPNSATLPETCTVGDIYTDTDADTNGSLYICVSANTWKEVDDDGGAGGMATTDIDTSAEIATIVTDEVGSGALAFATSTPFTTSITPNSAGASTLGTTALEWGNVYLTDSAVIYGQADQSNTMTSSATGFSVNLPFGLMSSDDPDVAAAGKITHDTDGWLRVYDNSLQKALSLMYEVQVTIIKPNDLADAQRDAFLVYSNETGMNFVITGWKGWSDVDDTTLNIETTAADGQTNATVDAVELATNGTGVYTGADTSITAGTIANGSLIWLDFDDTDTPGIVHMTIYGYLAGDVN